MQDFCSNSPRNGPTVTAALPQGHAKAGGGCLWLAGLWQRLSRTEPAAPSTLALPTCELRTEDLRVVDDVLPELLELGYPCNVLQQPHKVPANHEAVHELGKGEGKKKINLIYCLPAPEQGEGKRHWGAGGGEGRNSQSFNLTAGSR